MFKQRPLGWGILPLFTLFQNVLTASAARVACETETRLVIKISSYACLLEKQAIKAVLKGRLKYIININRYVQGWKEGREGSGETLRELSIRVVNPVPMPPAG